MSEFQSSKVLQHVPKYKKSNEGEFTALPKIHPSGIGVHLQSTEIVIIGSM